MGGASAPRPIMVPKRLLIGGYLFLLLLNCTRSGNAAEPGFLEEHLKIISPKEIELAEGNPSRFAAGNYAEYPLIILSKAKKKSAGLSQIGTEIGAFPCRRVIISWMCKDVDRGCPRKTPTIHGCLESDRPRRYEHRYQHSLMGFIHS